MIRFLAVLSGTLLVAAVTLMTPWAALPAIALVVAGWWFRSAAVAAVLLAVGVLVWADTGVLAAAATGLVATTYLLNTATTTAPHGVVPTTIPSVAGAVTFTAATTGAALLPLHLTWAPLAAPILVILLYALLTHALAPRRTTVR
ncbi:hypothetical protein [Nocardia donostiensis]|uniref:Integral membrane protein n=1 Tax=Nocardia donostiensis TaxID=1538463 RepID=A0A1V2TDR4_9NOCA|nr:hypothetical protein [Nocardia donostiensis]ONM47639.1 hypothetical protein B0T46_17260 [Nocardia donostiensis]OQS15015.1 hypothetical protein B0T36_10040 [Nocardia donostiensis]OQS24189.1 hypothetical protein B0T44_00775 [Nocardia donostiensis]